MSTSKISHLHLHLRVSDANFALRRRLIKSRFSQTVPDTEWRSETRKRRGERGIWQRRYWEHLIRNDAGYAAHMDYVHINPLKHGLVSKVVDWPYSTFHRLVGEGVYSSAWAGAERVNEFETPVWNE